MVGKLPRDGRSVVFNYKSGMRTVADAAQLGAAAGSAPAYILRGRHRCVAAGRTANHRRSIATAGIMRRMQITAGVLVLNGVLFGTFVAPGFFELSAFVGAGLIFAGMAGWLA